MLLFTEGTPLGMLLEDEGPIEEELALLLGFGGVGLSNGSKVLKNTGLLLLLLLLSII